MLSQIPEDYACPLCSKKLSLINTEESALHHCHLCGLIIDLLCSSCNSLENKKETFRNRFIFGYSIKAKIGKIPLFMKLENAKFVIQNKHNN